MAIPAWLFLSFWAIISLTFLKLGFNSLSRTDLYSTPVSPAVMSLLKHAFAISVCHSSNYALAYRHWHSQDKQRGYESQHLNMKMVKHSWWIGNALSPLVLWGSAVKNKWYYIYVASLNLVAIAKERGLTDLPEDHIGLNVDFVVKLSMFFVDSDEKLMPTLVLLASLYTSAVWGVISDDEVPFQAAIEKHSHWPPVERMAGLLCAVFSEKRAICYRWGKLVRFGIGMVGTILFQSFIRLTTFDHVLAFLYLAVAWLGNLAMLRPKGGDLGVFDFLLGNVVVGCTVSQFGVRGTTWVAFGAAFLLYGLRLKMEAMPLLVTPIREAAASAPSSALDNNSIDDPHVAIFIGESGNEIDRSNGIHRGKGSAITVRRPLFKDKNSYETGELLPFRRTKTSQPHIHGLKTDEHGKLHITYENSSFFGK